MAIVENEPKVLIIKKNEQKSLLKDLLIFEQRIKSHDLDFKPPVSYIINGFYSFAEKLKQKCENSDIK